MNSSTLCSLMLTLFLILIFHSLLLTNARVHGHDELLGKSPDFIGQICKDTSQDNITCMNILKADPKIVQAKDFFEFSKAILRLALKKGKKGQNFLKSLVTKDSPPAIAECATFFYDGVVGSFWSALHELKDSPDTANYDAKVAGDGPANCETALAADHIVNPAISALNHQISLLSNIAFLATNNLPF